MTDHWLTTPLLEGTHVTLRPLERGDAAALLEAAREGEMWTTPFTVVPGPGTAEAYVDNLLSQYEASTALPFAVIEHATGTVIGTSRYLHIDRPNRNLEIGGTFIARRVQGTRVNPEMKLLMLAHAFETIGCLRVSLQTDERNLHSQAAITKLGAIREGVRRRDRIMPDGFVRNSVHFSILDSEWPTVKAGLLARLG